MLTPRRALVLALLAGSLFATGCRSTAPPIDLDALRSEGRLLDHVPDRPLSWGARGPYPADGEAFVWSGHEAQVSLVPAGTLFRPATRLLVGIRGTSGRCSRFVIDTGSSLTMMSTGSGLAVETLVLARSAIVRGDADPGRLAVLPSVRMGGLVGNHPVIGLVPIPHDIDSPANILGLDLLRTLVLRHRDGRWTLLNGVSASPPPGASRIALAGPGLPVITLRDGRGLPVHALIDTGAPWSFAVVPAETGTFALADEAGRTILDVPADRSIDWRGLEIGGHRISVLLGLDVLRTIDFDLDLEGGAWWVRPVHPAAVD